MKKKLNYYKVVALVLLLVELGIAIFINKDLVKQSLTAWRLYIACVIFIPINIIFILIKQKMKVN